MLPLVAGAAVAAPLVARAAPLATRAVSRVSPALIERATRVLKGKITPGDVDLFGKFGEMIESGPSRGNLGQTGQMVQSFVKDVFGRQSGGWSNTQVKKALDLLLQQKGVYGR